MKPKDVAIELLRAGLALVGPAIIEALRDLLARHDAGEPLPVPRRVEPVGAGDLVGELVDKLSKEASHGPR